MISITHNGGFFSCCSMRLNKIISYFNNNEKLPDPAKPNIQDWYIDGTYNIQHASC